MYLSERKKKNTFAATTNKRETKMSKMRYMFSNLTALEKVTIGVALEVISECLFANDALLKEANISGIKVVEGGAFMNCTTLDTIDLSITFNSYTMLSTSSYFFIILVYGSVLLGL